MTRKKSTEDEAEIQVNAEGAEPAAQTPVTIDHAAGEQTEWAAMHDGIKRDPEDASPILPTDTDSAVGQIVK